MMLPTKKINFSISIRAILIILLILVVVVEGYFAFTLIYLKTKIDQATLKPQEVVRIDMDAYKEARDNVLEREKVINSPPASIVIPRNNLFK
jgi:hypothetical protein